MNEKEIINDLTNAILYSDTNHIYQATKKLIAALPYNKSAVDIWCAATTINYGSNYHWQEQIDDAWNKLHFNLNQLRNEFFE